MRENPRPQEIYRHFKGNLYQILSLAEHSETGETLVVYQALYGEFKVYARELAMFMSETDYQKYPSATQKYRFERVEVKSNDTRGQEKDEEKLAKADAYKPESESIETKIQETTVIETETTEAENEELQIDPLVMEFLDADSYEERLQILVALQNRITDEMINIMAVSADLEIGEGSTEERYDALKNCLLTLEKYECNRLR